MKIYSDFPVRRGLQVLADLIAVAAIVSFVWLGVVVHGLVAALGDFGRQLEGAGTSFRETMAQAATTLGGVPLIGSGIRGPFDSASTAGATLESAGRAQQDFVAQLALWGGVAVAVVPILVVLVGWLLPRIRWSRRATIAAQLAAAPGGRELLALRALVLRSPAELMAVTPDPVAAWKSADVAATTALANLTLRRAGVRLP